MHNLSILSLNLTVIPFGQQDEVQTWYFHIKRPSLSTLTSDLCHLLQLFPLQKYPRLLDMEKNRRFLQVPCYLQCYTKWALNQSEMKFSICDFGQIVSFLTLYIKMIVVNTSQLVGRIKGGILLKVHSTGPDLQLLN